MWLRGSKCHVKLFTLIIIALLLSVLLLQVAFSELDRRRASSIGSERDEFMRNINRKKSSINKKEYTATPEIRGHLNEKDDGTLTPGHQIQNGIFNSVKLPSSSPNLESASSLKLVKKSVDGSSLAMQASRSPLPDPYEVSESQFVVYRESRFLENQPQHENITDNDYGQKTQNASSSSLVPQASTPASVLADHSDNGDSSQLANPNQDQSSISEDSPSWRNDNNDNLIEAARAAAITGAIIGERVGAQVDEQQRQEEDPTAMLGTNSRFWTGRPLEPKPDQPATGEPDENNNDADDESGENESHHQNDNSQQPNNIHTSNNHNDQQLDERSSSGVIDSTDSMPDSIESLMSLDPGAEGDATPAELTGAGATKNQQQRIATAAKQHQHRANGELDLDDDNNHDSNFVSHLHDEPDVDYESSQAASLAPSPQGTRTSGIERSGPIAGMDNQGGEDLSAAAGHHYGKKKKKKKKVYKVKKVKKIKKIKKKKIKKKKKKIIIIKKKKVKGKKKYGKKKMKKHHHHHKPDHGKYYM